MKRILIIEDDRNIADIERDFLEIEGFHVDICEDGRVGLAKARREAYDLILLDLMLPGMSGIDICKTVRSEIDIPILMVTANAEGMDIVRGLGLGANDYITKPFSPTELVARVRSHLIQYERIKGNNKKDTDAHVNEVNIDQIRINILTHRVFVGNEEIELKNKEYELLLFLMQNPDIVFSKEHLYERIWGMDAIGDLKTVAVHINRIRDKIERDPQNPFYIQTVWGVGYRFKI